MPGTLTREECQRVLEEAGAQDAACDIADAMQARLLYSGITETKPAILMALRWMERDLGEPEGDADERADLALAYLQLLNAIDHTGQSATAPSECLDALKGLPEWRQAMERAIGREEADKVDL